MKGLIAVLAASVLFCGSAWADGSVTAVMTGGQADDAKGWIQQPGADNHESEQPSCDQCKKQDCGCKQEKHCGCEQENHCGCKHESECGCKHNCGCKQEKHERGPCERWGCDRDHKKSCCQDECGRNLKLTGDSPIKPCIPDQGHWELDPNCCPRECYCLGCCPRAEFKLLCCGKPKCGCQKECKPKCKERCGCDDCADRKLLDLRNNQ